MRRLLALAALPLAACAAPAGTAPYRAIDVTGDVVPAAAAPAFALMTPVEHPVVPFTLDRLAFVRIMVRKGGSGSFKNLGDVPSVGSAVVGRQIPPIKLVNLAPQTKYYVRLEGWQTLPGQAAPENVTDADASKSTTMVDTEAVVPGETEASNAQVTLAGGFRLKLANQAFTGTATGTLDGKDGDFKAPPAAVTLVTE